MKKKYISTSNVRDFRKRLISKGLCIQCKQSNRTKFIRCFKCRVENSRKESE